METPTQQFNSCAGRWMIHLRGREQALELFGWTGCRAERVALACLHGGVSSRARERGSWTRTPNRSGAAIHADRVGLATGEAAACIRRIGRAREHVEGADAAR